MIRSSAGRWGLWVACAVIAGLAIVSGSDRAGVSLVSQGPFAQSMRLQIAGGAVAAGRPAVEPAEVAVRYAPLRRGHLSILALALAGEGRTEEASRALVAALGTGWRDPVAQALAVEAAVRGGEADVAMLRAEALLRTVPEAPVAQSALAKLAEVPAMRTALAGALARNERWSAAALAGVRSLRGRALAERLALLAEARGAGWRPDLAEVRRFAGELFEEDPQTAWAAWTALAGPGDLATHGLWDGRFGGLAAYSGTYFGPFAWNVRAGSSVTAISAGGRLLVSGGGLVAEPVAVQRTMLGAGTHLLSWRSTERRAGEPALTLTAECPSAPATLESGPVVAMGDRYARTLRLAGACGVAINVLALSGDSGGRSIEDVRLGGVGG